MVEGRRYPEPGSEEYTKIAEQINDEGMDGDAAVVVRAGTKLSSEEVAKATRRALEGEKTVDLETFLATHKPETLGSEEDLKKYVKEARLMSLDRVDRKQLASMYEKIPAGTAEISGDFRTGQIRLDFKDENGDFQRLDFDATSIADLYHPDGITTKTKYEERIFSDIKIDERELEQKLDELGYDARFSVFSEVRGVFEDIKRKRDEKRRAETFKSR